MYSSSVLIYWNSSSLQSIFQTKHKLELDNENIGYLNYIRDSSLYILKTSPISSTKLNFPPLNVRIHIKSTAVAVCFLFHFFYHLTMHKLMFICLFIICNIIIKLIRIIIMAIKIMLNIQRVRLNVDVEIIEWKQSWVMKSDYLYLIHLIVHWMLMRLLPSLSIVDIRDNQFS